MGTEVRLLLSLVRPQTLLLGFHPPPLLVESVIPLPGMRAACAQAEFFVQALLEGLEPPTRKQVIEFIKMLVLKMCLGQMSLLARPFCLEATDMAATTTSCQTSDAFLGPPKCSLHIFFSQPSHLFCSIALQCLPTCALPYIGTSTLWTILTCFVRFLRLQAGLYGVSLLMAASFESIRTSACGVSSPMLRKGPSFCLSNPAFIALSPGLGIARSWLRMRAEREKEIMCGWA